MNHRRDNTWQPIELGEALIASGVDGLFRGWQASAEVVGKVRTGASRWQAVIRQMHSSVNFAEILRARAPL